MWRRLGSFVYLGLFAAACSAADLTATELRWLTGARPVIAFAHAQQLPLDIVVQPQDTPGAAPLALAFIAGRCKLVLSMRGNPEAAATLERVTPDLRDLALELMAAHELAHCRRYVDGAWYALPAGFSAPTLPPGLGAETRAMYLAMQAARREEGFADLAGLAWIQQRHPDHYTAMHTWLVAERTRERMPRSHHDTLVWLQRAKDGTVFADRPLFMAAAQVWTAALADDE